MADLIETTAGAVLGGLVTLLRHPARLRQRARPRRRRARHAAARPIAGGRRRSSVRFVGHATTVLELGGVRIATDPLLRTTLGPLERHGAPPEAALVRGRRRGPRLARPSGPLRSAGRSPDRRPRRPSSCRAGSAGRRRARWTARSSRSSPASGSRSAASRSRSSPPATGSRRARRGRSRSATSSGRPARRPSTSPATRAGSRASTALAGRVDLALLPVWTWGPHLGPGHLGPRSAAEVLGAAGRGRLPSRSTGGRSTRAACPASGTGRCASPGVRFAGHASHLAPAADVRVLQPGASADVHDGRHWSPAPASAPLGGRLDR